MSRSQILPLVFGAALCVAPTLLLAETTQGGQSGDRPETSVVDDTQDQQPAVVDESLAKPETNNVAADTKTSGDADKVQKDAKETETVTGGETTKTPAAAQEKTETSLPIAAISAHIAAFNAFVYRQAVVPTVDLAGASVEAANNSARWIWDGSANSATWLWDGSSKSVNWVWDGSTGTLTAAVSGIGSSLGALSDTIKTSSYWPANAMDKFVADLHSDEFEEFAELVEKTGFAISDVKVGVGLIPDLAVEFKHVRDLTEEELAEIDRKIHEHTSQTAKGVGYIESVILHNLVDAGQYAGKTDLSSVSIKLFPLPGLVLKFDPFDYQEHKANKLKSAFDLAKVTAEAEQKLEDRLSNIEAEIRKLHSQEEKDTN